MEGVNFHLASEDKIEPNGDRNHNTTTPKNINSVQLI